MTRKRAAESLSTEAEKRQKLDCNKDEKTGTETSSWLDTRQTVAASPAEPDDTDSATAVLDDRYVELRLALSYLDQQRQYLMLEPVLGDDIQSQLLAVWSLIKGARDSYERCFHCFDYSDTLPIQQRQESVVVDGQRPHSHTISRPGRFMKLVGRVLKEEVFRMDLLHQLRDSAPIAECVNILQEIHRYDFDYSENAEVYQAKAMNVLKRSDQHIILPAIRVGGRTVGRALAYYNWTNCE
ncbi:hypothetical protein LTS08_008880 [Lithohypha guttulata]|nr:hypothetical protein LTS08_008880 [Lithohypha guttulata]